MTVKNRPRLAKPGKFPFVLSTVFCYYIGHKTFVVWF
jgi:hypothetical protein